MPLTAFITNPFSPNYSTASTTTTTNREKPVKVWLSRLLKPEPLPLRHDNGGIELNLKSKSIGGSGHENVLSGI